MCGINGILHLHSQKKVDERILTKMRNSLEHRGSDDKGLFMENNVGFGHRRLSVLDVSAAGHQPFLSDDGRYVMVYNGEIYNFKDFYPELKSHLSSNVPNPAMSLWSKKGSLHSIEAPIVLRSFRSRREHR